MCHVDWIVEQEQDEGHRQCASLLETQLVLQIYWHSAQYLGGVKAHNEQASQCENGAKKDLIGREVRVDVGDVEVD